MPCREPLRPVSAVEWLLIGLLIVVVLLNAVEAWIRAGACW
jgi:hypothetical protein